MVHYKIKKGFHQAKPGKNNYMQQKFYKMLGTANSRTGILLIPAGNKGPLGLRRRRLFARRVPFFLFFIHFFIEKIKIIVYNMLHIK
jgi:hypothetical protein